MCDVHSRSIMPGLFDGKSTNKKKKMVRKDLDDGTDWPLVKAFVGIAVIATGFLALGLFSPDLVAGLVDYLTTTSVGLNN